MEELKRLQENIEKLIKANYPDEALDEAIADSWNLNDLNEALEDELSYAVEAMEE